MLVWAPLPNRLIKQQQEVDSYCIFSDLLPGGIPRKEPPRCEAPGQPTILNQQKFMHDHFKID